MIVTLACPKGGVGKTKLSMNIAIELHDRGRKVSFVDGETKGPAAKVMREIEPAIESRAETAMDEIHTAISELQETCDDVVLDMPGVDADRLIGVCMFSDFVLIPIQPAETDLDQTKPFLKLVKAFQLQTGGSPHAVLLFTFTRINDVSAKNFKRALKPLGIPIAETQIRRLDDYRDNQLVMRVPALNTRGAATDIRRLIDELFLKPESTKEVMHG